MRLRRSFERKKPFRLWANANLHKDGHEVFLETSATPMFDAQGVFKGYRGIDRDITERKEAERDASPARKDWNRPCYKPSRPSQPQSRRAISIPLGISGG